MAIGNTAGAECWQRWVDLQKQSGLSIRAFCKHNHLTTKTFHRWKNRLERGRLTRPAARSASNLPEADARRLLPVQIIPSTPAATQASHRIQILTPSGYCIRLNSHLSIEQWVRALRTELTMEAIDYRRELLCPRIRTMAGVVSIHRARILEHGQQCRRTTRQEPGDWPQELSVRRQPASWTQRGRVLFVGQ